MTTAAVPDWTLGGAGIALQRCSACGTVWYFERDFCPACGTLEPRRLAAAGGGVVYATTVVHRAPDDAFRSVAPYRLVLVELDEGPRVMGHAPLDLLLGERVAVGFREIAGRLLPYFERAASTPR